MTNTSDYDLVVIGAGLAGLSAVLEAARNQPNLKIALLEKQDRIGGNSAKASSGINAISSESDQIDFLQDTIVSGHEKSNKELVQILVDQSQAAIKFLEDEHIDLSVRSQLGGHCQSRTRRNRSGPNIGFAIISALQAAVQRYDNIQIKTSCRVISIKPDPADPHHLHLISYQHDDKREEQIQSRALIITTGGFASNPVLLAQYRPEIAHLPTTNGPWANGDGIQLASSGYDAALIDMDQIQIHPTGFVDPADRSNGHKILAPEALRGSGGILIDGHGRRFVNELSTRDIVADAVMSAPGSHAFLILDESAAQTFGMGPMQFYMKRGLARKCSNISDIANQIALNGDAPVDILTDTINSYRHAVAHKHDQFGKTVFPSEFRDSEFYVMEIVPVLHYCMGGLRFDTNAHLLNTKNEPIPGLYGAGEVTGGLHGANRLAGNSLLECVVYGRIAAKSALEYIRQN